MSHSDITFVVYNNIDNHVACFHMAILMVLTLGASRKRDVHHKLQLEHSVLINVKTPQHDFLCMQHHEQPLRILSCLLVLRRSGVLQNLNAALLSVQMTVAQLSLGPRLPSVLPNSLLLRALLPPALGLLTMLLLMQPLLGLLKALRRQSHLMTRMSTLVMVT